MSDPQDPDIELVRTAADALMEHFDSVHIFATRHEAGEHDGTINLSWGGGNYYSRYGQIAEWKIKQDESTRESVRDQD